MIVDALWYNKPGGWDTRQTDTPEAVSECYYIISPFGNKRAEFCDNGNIKIMIYNLDKSTHINLPSREDMELFYTYDTQIYSYIPVLFNGRLI